MDAASRSRPGCIAVCDRRIWSRTDWRLPPLKRFRWIDQALGRPQEFTRDIAQADVGGRSRNRLHGRPGRERLFTFQYAMAVPMRRGCPVRKYPAVACKSRCIPRGKCWDPSHPAFHWSRIYISSSSRGRLLTSSSFLLHSRFASYKLDYRGTLPGSPDRSQTTLKLIASKTAASNILYNYTRISTPQSVIDYT